MKQFLILCLLFCAAYGSAQKTPVYQGKVIRNGGKTLRNSIPATPVTPPPVTPPPANGDVSVPAEGVAARVYYMSPTGSNTRTETEAQNEATPWRDFGALQNRNLAPGYHIVLADGEYGPSMTAYNDVPMVIYANGIDRGWRGTAANPIVVKAAAGATPVLTTLTTALSPVSVSGYPNVYAYAINSLDELASVRIDNRYREVTRYPKRTETGHKGYLMGRTKSGGGLNQSATITANWIPAQNIVGADLVMRHNEYHHFAHKITGQTSNTVTFDNMGHSAVDEGFGSYFQNHISFLTADGDWAVKSVEGGVDTLYVYFADNQPFNHTVRYATSNNVVWSLNTHYVQFRGLTFEGSSNDNVRLQSSRTNMFIGCSFRGAGRNGIFQVNGADSTIVVNSTFKHCNAGGVDLATEPNCIIENNTFDSTSIFMVRPNWNVEYRSGVLTRVYAEGFAGFATVSNGGTNSKSRFNRVTYSGHCGIVFNGANAVVYGNFVNWAVLRVTDLGGIYTYQKGQPNFTAGQTRLVSHNIVLNVPGEAAGTPSLTYAPVFGLYFDDDADRINAEYNTVANVTRGAIYMHHTQYINARYNNFLNQEYGYYMRYGDNSSTKLPEGNVMSYNVVVSTADYQIDSSLTMVNQGVFADLQTSQFATWSNNSYFAHNPAREHQLIYNATSSAAAVPYTGTGWNNIATGAALPASPLTLDAFRSVIAARMVASGGTVKPPSNYQPAPANTPTRTGDRQWDTRTR